MKYDINGKCYFLVYPDFQIYLKKKFNRNIDHRKLFVVHFSIYPNIASIYQVCDL